MLEDAGRQAGESSGDKMATLRTYLLTEVQRTSYRAVAKRLGLDHRTVWNMVQGLNGNPTMRTVERIERGMSKNEI